MWSKAQLGGRRMRLIDADKLIKDINDYFKNEVGKIHKNVQQEVLFLVCDTILDHNSGVLKVIESQPVSKVNEWIPVSKKKHPDEDGEYIVCVKGCMSGQIRVRTASYEYEEWRINYAFDLLAWMPLPQPYKGE